MPKLDDTEAAKTLKTLAEKMKQGAREQWLRENKDAIKRCNELSEAHGLFAEKHRVF
ncbi:MAG: type II toxin-antitoxin system CcdA family antitoxin [Cellvibrionaceae bacterium]|nr:type II toxin-antitoxin system CcdA family antitoxin [Cellvibrionaceae bacterium]